MTVYRGGEHVLEREFWNSLNSDQVIENTVGVPPYDVGEVARLIIDFLNIPGGMVLDLGCGTGRLSDVVSSEGQMTVYGVDISPTMIKIATANTRHDTYYFLGDGRQIPGDVPGFDAAYSVTMFQHIPHEAMWGYIRQVHDALPVSGKFIFTVAVGDEPQQFLNHQIEDIGEFAVNLTDLFPDVSYDPPDQRGWTWVRCTK